MLHVHPLAAEGPELQSTRTCTSASSKHGSDLLTRDRMSIELDHIFLLTSAGAEREARILLDAGLAEGPPNTHPGQGTACRRFFLDNAYIELLWITDPREASSPLCTPTGLLARWLGRHADTCPIGICTRPASGELPSPPFQSWRYTPPYLPPGLHIDMALDTHDARRPLCFHLSFAQAPLHSPRIARESLVHPGGINTLASAAIAGPHAHDTLASLLPHLPTLHFSHAVRWTLTLQLASQPSHRTSRSTSLTIPLLS
jgi:hypothetical protein